jgi:hypothetical protein
LTVARISANDDAFVPNIRAEKTLEILLTGFDAVASGCVSPHAFCGGGRE